MDRAARAVATQKAKRKQEQVAKKKDGDSLRVPSIRWPPASPDESFTETKLKNHNREQTIKLCQTIRPVPQQGAS